MELQSTEAGDFRWLRLTAAEEALIVERRQQTQRARDEELRRVTVDERRIRRFYVRPRRRHQRRQNE